MGLPIIEPLGGIELEYVGTTVPSGAYAGQIVTVKTSGGVARFQLVKNSLGSTLTQYLAYILRLNASGEVVVLAAGDDALVGHVGIPQLAGIADGNYFWCGIGGVLTYTSAAAIAAHAQLSLSTTDGKLDDAAITGKFLNAFNHATAASAADESRTLYCSSSLFYGASN